MKKNNLFKRKGLLTSFLVGALTLFGIQSSYAQCASGQDEYVVTINSGSYGAELAWSVYSGSGTLVDSVTFGTYANNTTYYDTICLTPGTSITFNAYDDWGDGWNGGTYSISRSCDLALVANNGGAVPDNTVGTGGTAELEVSETFTSVSTACPTCAFPTAATLDSVTINSATIAWTAGGTETQWEIEYDTVGFSQGNGTSITTTTNPHVISSLTANTSYEYYIRGICGVGDTSAWVGPFSFITLCNTFTVPFNEGFNSNSSSINCWSVYDANTDGDLWALNTDPSYVQEGDQSMQMYTDFNAGANLDLLASPGIILTGNERLKYWYRAHAASEPNDYKVVIADDINNPSFVDTLLHDTANSATYAEQIIDLSAYTGTHYIGFLVDSGGLDGWNLYIDNFTVEAIPNCFAVDSIDATNIHSTTASLSWVDVNSASNFQIEYDTAGFTLGTGMDSVISTTSFSASGLTPSTAYDVYVRAICGPGDSSVWEGPYTFNTLCTPYVAPYTESFDSTISPCWQQSAIQGGPWVTTGTPGYGASSASDNTGNGGNFLWLDFSVPDEGVIITMNDVDVSALTTPSVNFYMYTNNTNDAAINSLYVEAYDGTTWNQVGLIQQNIGGWANFVFDLSSNVFGSDLVRVRFRGEPSAVGDAYYQDVLLDDISILEAPTCFDPQNIVASNISADSADISFVQPGQNDSIWLLEYDVSGFSLGSGQSTTLTATNTTLSSLSSNTSYDVYVRSVCAAGDTSAWVGPYSFSTLCSVFSVPFNEGFNSSSTTISCWSVYDNNSDGDMWSINTNTSFVQEGDQSMQMYTDFNGGNNLDLLASPGITLTGNEWLRYWSRARSVTEPNDYMVLITDDLNSATYVDTLFKDTVNSTTYAEHIIDLSAYTGTNYIGFFVDSGGLDGWYVYVDNFTVETIPTCFEVDSILASNITSSTADISWVDTTSATSWQIEYDVTGFTLGTGMDSIISSASFNASGLSANTSYDVYVRTVCGAGDTSLWEGPYNFTTLCNAFEVAPYTESFDVSISACWSQYAATGGPWVTTGTPGYGASTVQDNTGNGGNFVWMDFSGTDDSVSLEMIDVDISALTVPYLSFYFYTNNTDDTSINDLFVEAYNGTNWVLIDSIHQNIGGWDEFGYNLSGFTYNTNFVKVRFRAESGGSSSDYYQDFVIDDISIIEMPPPISAAATVSDATCFYDSDGNISLTTTGGAGAPYAYVWSTGDTTSAISSLVAGDYVVTIYDADNDSILDTISVGSYPEVMVSLGNDTALCDGQSLTLDAGSFVSYTWDAAQTTQTRNVSGVVGTVTMWVEVTDTNSCIGSDTIVVTGYAPVVVDLGADTLVCDGESVTLDAGAFTNYAWNDASTNQTLATTSMVGNSTYWVVVEDANGCEGTDSIVVTGNTPVAVDLGADTTLCDGASMNLDAGIFVSYLWDDSTIAQTRAINSMVGANSYWVEAADLNGCTGSDTIVVTGLPALSVNLGADTSICFTDNITLDAGAFATYLWDDNSANQTRVVGGNVGANMYSVTVTNADGCEADASVEVTVLPEVIVDLGADTFITDTTATLLLDAGTGFNSYLWSDGSTQRILVVDKANSGEISIEVTDAIGCTGYDTINVDFATSVANITLTNVKMYPNPVSDNLIIEVSTKTAGEMVSIKLLSITGQELTSQQVVASQGKTTHTMDVSKYANGTYFVELISGDQKHVQTILIK